MADNEVIAQKMSGGNDRPVRRHLAMIGTILPPGIKNTFRAGPVDMRRKRLITSSLKIFGFAPLQTKRQSSAFPW